MLFLLLFYYRYSALGPVWAETRAQSGDWHSSGTLHPGQVLRGSLPLLSSTIIIIITTTIIIIIITTTTIIIVTTIIIIITTTTTIITTRNGSCRGAIGCNWKL